MNAQERAEFRDALAETAKLLRLAQETVQRARAQCHGEIYEQVDVMSKRVYELWVKAEWLRDGVARGGTPANASGDANARIIDRRRDIDRRVVGMRNELLASGAVQEPVTDSGGRGGSGPKR